MPVSVLWHQSRTATAFSILLTALTLLQKGIKSVLIVWAALADIDLIDLAWITLSGGQPDVESDIPIAFADDRKCGGDVNTPGSCVVDHSNAIRCSVPEVSNHGVRHEHNFQIGIVDASNNV